GGGASDPVLRAQRAVDIAALLGRHRRNGRAGFYVDAVVGGIDRADPRRAAVENLHLDRELFRQPAVVVVEERDVLAARVGEPGVAARGLAAIDGMPEV